MATPWFGPAGGPGGGPAGAMDKPEISDALPNDFVGFWVLHQGNWLRYAVDRLGSRPDAEDVLHETMIALYGRWESVLRHSSPPEALAFTVLRGKVIDKQRQRCRSREVLTDFTASDALHGVDLASSAGDPGETVPSDADLSAALARMPERRQTCAVLCLVLGLTAREAAGYLGITVSAVRSHIHEARKDLAADLLYPLESPPPAPTARRAAPAAPAVEETP